MKLYSSDLSVLVNLVDNCFYDLRVNPDLITNNPGGTILLNNTNSIILAGNGSTVPITATSRISSASGNQISVNSDGLFVPASTIFDPVVIRQLISATSPIIYNSATGVISIQIANTNQNGALTSVDWNTFNSKVTTAANVGSGIGVFKQKNSSNILEFKRFQAGANTSIIESGDSIIISSSGTGGNSYTDIDARLAISATGPLTYNNVTGVLGITQATTSTPGYLTSSDWNEFNQKVPQTRLINTIYPLQGGGALTADLTLSVALANNDSNGYLSSTDWAYFNQKQNPITWQTVNAGSNKIILGGTPVSSVNNPFSIDVVEINLNRANFSGITPISGGGTSANNAPQALINLLPDMTGQSGKVLGTDGTTPQWVTGGGGGGGENPLTFTLPLFRVTDNISIYQSNTTTDGYLSSSNWNYFNSKVDDAAMIAGAGASIYGSKIGNIINLKKLVASTNMVITEDSGAVYFSATGGSGGGMFLTTVAALKANAATQITDPYYIVNDGQEGFFHYDAAGGATVSNGGSTNASGTIIRSADGRVFRRNYDKTQINGLWFGLVASADLLTAPSAGIQSGNVTALEAMKAAALDNEQQYVPKGSYWLNFPISAYQSTLTKRSNFWSDGAFKTTSSGDCFTLTGTFAQVWRTTDLLYGPNAATTTEAGYDGFVSGRGIYLKNLYNSEVDFDEIKFFKVGIEASGEGTGVQFSGCQMNRIKGSWINENHTQIKISRYGVPTPAGIGNFSNECFWNITQIGRWNGLPSDAEKVRNGVNGLVVINDVTNTATGYGLTGHIFTNCNFEGMKNGLVMDNCAYMKFVGCSFEGASMTTPFSLSPTTCESTIFQGCTLIYDTYFAAGRRGLRTEFQTTSIWAPDPANPSAVVPIGTAATSQPSTDNFLVSSDLYTGFTAFNLRLLNDYWVKKAEFPTIHDTMTRYSGVVRKGAYHPTMANITPSTAGATIDLPANIGYIRYEPSTTARTLRINAGDLVNRGPEIFYIEIKNTLYPTITRADTNVTVIPSSSFTSIGTWLCTWRENVGATAGEYYVVRIDGGSSGGSIVMGPIGATPNANGGTIAAGILTLQPASSSFGGVVTTGTQTWEGYKTFVRTITTRAGSTLSGTAPIKIPSGTLMSIQEPGAIENANGYLYYTDPLQNREPLCTANNIMILRHKRWESNTIDWQYGGTGRSTLGTAGQVLTVNPTEDALIYAFPSVNQNYEMIRTIAPTAPGIFANNTATLTVISAGDVPIYGPTGSKYKLRITGVMRTFDNNQTFFINFNLGGNVDHTATINPMMFAGSHLGVDHLFEFDVDLTWRGGTNYAMNWFFKGYNPDGWAFQGGGTGSGIGWTNGSGITAYSNMQWSTANANNRVTVQTMVMEIYKNQ